MMHLQKTYTCYVSGCTAPTDTVGHLCEEHKAAHRAKWKDEHTRKPGDVRTGWLIGDKCRVKLGRIDYKARILDMSDNADDSFYWTQLELTKTVQVFGHPLTQTWIHPKPVQSYKLRNSYEYEG
jgi:hypothetical protein